MKQSFHTQSPAPAGGAAVPGRQRRRTKREGLLHGSPGIDALLLRLHAANDIPAFWAALQELLRQTTPHDALIVYLNFLDFETSWQATEILATPNAQRPTKWFQNRRQVDMTPQFVLSQPKKLKIYRLSDVVPDRSELRRSAFFKEFLEPFGWHHLAVALYWRGDRVGSQIAIRRTAKQGDFTAQEIAFLEAVYPHIETVLNRLLAYEEERARRRWLEAFNHHLPFALLFLNWEMKSLYVNQAGLEQCALWNFGPAKARAYQPRAVFAPPAEVSKACAALKAEWLEHQSMGQPHPGGATKVNHPTQAGLTATIRLHIEEHVRTAYPGFIVYLENQTSVPAMDRLPAHSLLGQLTVAEREIARQVTEGLDNEEIARRLRKSVKTVKGQLTSIFKKLGVNGRNQLMARLR
ncbi:MAG: LuxR C-terminal-related transcriptional regulator [Verrucomicrobia bacterium]|nr:LuxR C-terminal-related transcriptional regulator [Verrucomicrobiota bacterium]